LSRARRSVGRPDIVVATTPGTTIDAEEVAAIVAALHRADDELEPPLPAAEAATSWTLSGWIVPQPRSW
jgi:hypothetical protein